MQLICLRPQLDECTPAWMAQKPTGARPWIRGNAATHCSCVDGAASTMSAPASAPAPTAEAHPELTLRRQAWSFNLQDLMTVVGWLQHEAAAAAYTVLGGTAGRASGTASKCLQSVLLKGQRKCSGCTWGRSERRRQRVHKHVALAVAAHDDAGRRISC
jgi:hypothetical protein